MTDKEYLEAFNHCMKVEGCFGCSLYGESNCHEKLADGINGIIQRHMELFEKIEEIKSEARKEFATKFITFRPNWEYDEYGRGNICISATVQLNDWLKENPDIEVIDWQTCPVGITNELYITIQYKEG